MPWSDEWIANELFLEHNGVRIFHTYKYDEGHARSYSFGTASDTSDHDDDTNFDVTQLPTWPKKRTAAESEDETTVIKNAIITAIDNGSLEEYIKAAENRPKDIEGDFEADNLRTNELKASILQAQLETIQECALAQIAKCYTILATEPDGVVNFTPQTVDYSDGAEYSIKAIKLSSDKSLLIVQDEEDGPENDEQYLEGMEPNVLIEILAVLESKLPEPVSE